MVGNDWVPSFILLVIGIIHQIAFVQSANHISTILAISICGLLGGGCLAIISLVVGLIIVVSISFVNWIVGNWNEASERAKREVK
jgi:uncharacterized membrane protein